MRYHDLLKENTNVDKTELFEQIINSDFYKHCYDTEHYLVHTSQNNKGDFVILDVDRMRSRTPKDTSTQVHDYINQETYLTFNTLVRNGLFAYRQHIITRFNTGFGNNHYFIFPLTSNYDIYYNESIYDLTLDKEFTTSVLVDNYVKKEAEEYVNGLQYTNNIKEVSHKRVELMIFGKLALLSEQTVQELNNYYENK